MKETFFTLKEDCLYKDRQLNKDDIVLTIPVPADYLEVREWFEEDNIDYNELISLYIYSREVFVKAMQEGDWIFSHEPKDCDFIHYSCLPDLLLKLSITAAEIDFGDIEVTKEE